MDQIKKTIAIEACRRLNTLYGLFNELYVAFYAMTEGVDTEAEDYEYPKEWHFKDVKIEFNAKNDTFLRLVADVYYQYAEYCGVESPLYETAKAIGNAFLGLYAGDMEFGPIPTLPVNSSLDTNRAFAEIYDDIMKGFMELFHKVPEEGFFVISPTEDFDNSETYQLIRRLVADITMKHIFDSSIDKYISAMTSIAAAGVVFS